MVKTGKTTRKGMTKDGTERLGEGKKTMDLLFVSHFLGYDGKK